MRTSSYKVDEWTVRPDLNLLEGPNGQVSLEPKVMALLVCLIKSQCAAHGAVTTKQELINRVWNGQHIADSAVTRSVSELRRALADDAQAPRFIETIAKKGYRFIAPIEELPPLTPRASLSRKWPVAAAATAAFVGVVALSLAWSSNGLVPDFVEQAPPLPTARLMQITADPGVEAFGDLSPDGSSAVFSATIEGRFELFVQQLTPGAGRIQLTDDGQQNVQPTWSPDGRTIAYHSISRGGLWLIPALGGEMRRLTTFGSRPDWLPDSKSLVFQSSTMTGIVGTSSAALPPSVICRIDLGAGEPRAITQRESPSGGHSLPRVSSDGARVVFVAYSDSDPMGRQLYSVDTNGIDVQPVLGVPTGEPVFSPDGRYIYSAGNFLGERWLWRTRISATSGEALAEPERLVRGIFRDLSFSADGSRLIATLIERSSNLFALELDSEAVTGIGLSEPGEGLRRERQLTRGTNFRDTSTAISPDGLRIAYRQQRIGQRDQIWTVSTDGTSNGQLTLDPDISAHFPTWTPDGLGVVYQTFRNGRRSLERVDVSDRQTQTWLEIPPNWQSVRPSHDGHSLLFHTETEVADASRDGETLMASNVFMAPIEGGRALEPRQLTDAFTFAGYGLLSPDKRWVAYELESDGHFLIETQEIESGQVRRLTHEGHNWPGSFLDDHRLAFVAQRRGIWNLYSVDLLSGEERQLTDNRSVERYYRNPAASPAGDLLVFERGSIEGDLWEIRLDG